MALTKREFAEKLRTMKRSGSKAPMQDVKLPTNQSSYRTPSMTTSTAGAGGGGGQQAPGTDPQSLAAAGGLLGKMAKGWMDAQNRPDTMALDKASAESMDKVGGLLGMLQGDNLDVASNMANQTATNMTNLPAPSMLGNGVPLPGAQNSAGLLGGAAQTGDWASTAGWAGENAADQLGNMSSVGDAVANAGDAASAATDAASNASSYSLPYGNLVGAGLNAAQGNYGKAVGSTIGGAAGSYFGPVGTWAGSTVGGLIGGLFR